MEIASVNQIREKRDKIRERIKSLNLKKNSSHTYGSENEYTMKSLIGGIEALLTDISTLVRHPSKFVKFPHILKELPFILIWEESRHILETPAHFIPQFEAIKILLRAYNVRYFSDRQIEFEKEIEEVRKIKLQFQQILVNSKDLSEQIDKSNSTLDEKLEKNRRFRRN